jgi:hypothetical protein
VRLVLFAVTAKLLERQSLFDELGFARVVIDVFALLTLELDESIL